MRQPTELPPADNAPPAAATVRPTLGIATVLAGIALFSAMDATAKWLTDYLPATQIAFLRNVLSLPIVLALVALALRQRARQQQRPIVWRDLRLRQWRLALFRGLLIGIAQLSFFAALTALPLATVATIAFIAPALMTVLAVLLLGERVGRWRWGAILFGFLGVLIIQRPLSPEAFSIWTLLPLVTACCYALTLVLAKTFDADSSTALVTLYAALMATLVNSVTLLFGVVAIPPAIWPAILLLGCLGGVGHHLLNVGFRLVPASLVAPFEYVGLLFAYLFSWFLFGELPTPIVWLGGSMILAAGAVIILRERRQPRP